MTVAINMPRQHVVHSHLRLEEGGLRFRIWLMDPKYSKETPWRDFSCYYTEKKISYFNRFNAPITKTAKEKKEIINAIKSYFSEIAEDSKLFYDFSKCKKHDYVSTMTHKEIYASDNLSSNGEPWHQGSAICKKCNARGADWFCIKSPTKMCEYDLNDDMQDECIHCGMPEERK